MRRVIVTPPPAWALCHADYSVLFQGSLTGERALISLPGKESFHGAIDPIGRIKLSGEYNDRGAWTYKFAGQLSDKQPTVLDGDLEVTNGLVGRRHCVLAPTA